MARESSSSKNFFGNGSLSKPEVTRTREEALLEYLLETETQRMTASEGVRLLGSLWYNPEERLLYTVLQTPRGENSTDPNKVTVIVGAFNQRLGIYARRRIILTQLVEEHNFFGCVRDTTWSLEE